MERENIYTGMIVRSVENPDVRMKIHYIYPEYRLDAVRAMIVDGNRFTRVGDIAVLNFDEIKEEV